MKYVVSNYEGIWTRIPILQMVTALLDQAPPLPWQNLGSEGESGIGEAWRPCAPTGSTLVDSLERVGVRWLRIAIERCSGHTLHHPESC